MKVEVPLGRDITMRLDERTQYVVSVLDVDAETILVRVPPRLALDDGPSRATLAFGHQNLYWEVPTTLMATYGPWWFLERPEEEECRRIQRRAFVRIAFETRLLVARPGSDEAVPLTTYNVSANGALASSKVDLGAPGTRLKAVLELPGYGQVSTAGQIVRVERNGSSRYGIHFLGMAVPVQEQVAQFVALQIQQSLQRGRDITLPREGVR